MLTELFVVSEFGTIIHHQQNAGKKMSSHKDPALISAFITAIQGFSQETFNSRFKGMELDNQTIFVLFDQVYFIGVFSYDELEPAAFRVLNQLAIYFNQHYSSTSYEGKELDLTSEFAPIIDKMSLKKVRTRNIAIVILITTIMSLFYFPVFSLLNATLTTKFYSWAGILVIGSIICGRLIPQRWIATIISLICATIPSFLVLFEINSKETLVLSDYTFALVFLPMLISSYIADRKYLNTKITPKIPILSRIM